jgi:cytochrome c2
MRAFVVGATLVCLSALPIVAQDTLVGDPVAGQTVFNRCKACHDIGDNAKNRMGPVLTGVFGRVAGTLPDYNYSKAMVEAGANGLVWTPETIDPFLTSPRQMVPGTKMNFAVSDATDRANVIAYLMTFSPDYVPNAASASGDSSSSVSPAPSNAVSSSSAQ